MKIVFSFDDGRDDAALAADILYKHGLNGSFHITTGFVDGTFKTDAFGIGRTPLTVDQINAMKGMGMDISLHGDKHITEVEDYKNSYEKMNKWLPKRTKIGMSVPNSKFTDGELSAFVSKLPDKLLYVRVGRNPKCYSLFGKISYVLYHIFHFQFLYNFFNKFNLISDFDKYKIYSLVVLNDTRIKNLKKFIANYSNKDCILVLMFHSIVDTPNNKWEYMTSDFIELCKFIKENSINTYTLEELSNE